MNWERGEKGVPERSELLVASVLKSELAGSGLVGREKTRDFALPADEDPEDESNAKVMEVVNRAAESATRHMKSREGSSDLAKIAVFGPLALEFAESAARLNADPEAVLNLLEAIVTITVETGAIAVPSETGLKPLRDVVVRGTRSADRLVADLDPSKVKPYRVSFDGPRSQLKEKLARRSNVTPIRKDEEAEDAWSTADEVPEFDPMKMAAKRGRRKADDLPHAE